MAFETTSTEALKAARRWWVRQGLVALAEGHTTTQRGIDAAINMIDAELAARAADVPHHTEKFRDADFCASFAG